MGDVTIETKGGLHIFAKIKGFRIEWLYIETDRTPNFYKWEEVERATITDSKKNAKVVRTKDIVSICWGKDIRSMLANMVKQHQYWRGEEEEKNDITFLYSI